MLHDELQFFIDNQKDLLKKYRNKVLVIKNQKVIASYDTPLQAYVATQLKHELGTFLIQKCEPGPDAYTVTVSSSAVSL